MKTPQKEYKITNEQKTIINKEIKKLQETITENSQNLKNDLLKNPREPNEFHHLLSDTQITLYFKVKAASTNVIRLKRLTKYQIYIEGMLPLFNTSEGSTWIQPNGEIINAKANAELGKSYSTLEEN